MKVSRVICISLFVLCLMYAQNTAVLINNARLVPKLMNYQGYLTDTFDIPINDTLDMTFKIFDAVSSGSELWSETQTNVPVERGVFSVLLGGIAPIPDSVFADFTSTWLELTLEGPQTLTPRTRITSVGYAYTSTYSDTADYAHVGVDNDWIRGTPDSVLFTSNYLGLARGGVSNALVGDSVHTHVNLGVLGMTGWSGEDFYYCTIGGGYGNQAMNNFTTVAGGEGQTAEGSWSTVSGGRSNQVYGVYSFIGGGYNNYTFEDTGASVVAGVSNRINNEADYSFIGGGYSNCIYQNAKYTIIGGGNSNTANFDGYCNTIGGGQGNTVENSYATISGGYGNKVYGSASMVGGGWQNIVVGDNAFIGGGVDDSVSGDYSCIVGGQTNRALADYSIVGGGLNNMVRNLFSIIGGGEGNHIWSSHSTIAGGENNSLVYESSDHSFIGGGYSNQSSGSYAVISGGEQNTIGSNHTCIGGGKWNYSAGNYSVISGGYADTIASGADYSYLFGIGSKLTQDSTFMVDMPHIWFGTEATGYEFPITDGSASQVMVTDGSGQLSWSAAPSDSDWSVINSVLYTNKYWGLARGGAGNVLYGDSNHTHVNWGVACTTGMTGSNRYCCTVGGGKNNTASLEYATVSGGRENIASGYSAVVGGGFDNQANGGSATVGGGQANSAVATYSTIAGGWLNNTGGQCAFVGGGQSNEASNNHTTVSGGYSNLTTSDYATVGGGYDNTAGYAATVAGGYQNSANGNTATIAGGRDNNATISYASVGGGYTNNANGPYSTISGGRNNAITHSYATICGGYNNTVGAEYATVLGGENNTANGSYSCAFGQNCTTGGSYAFAAGRRAKANQSGTFVWADGTDADFLSTNVNQFLIRATNGVGIGTSSPSAMLDVVGNVEIADTDAFLDFGTDLRQAINFWPGGANANYGIGMQDYTQYYRAAGNFAWFIGGTHSNSECNPGTGGTVAMVIKRPNSYVGIGTTTPAYRLDVAGSCHASSFPTSSDKRLKKDVIQLTNVLEKIQKIRGVAFDWNETYEELGRSTGHREIGVIAQEVEAVFPELVTSWGDKEYLGVDYGRLTAVLIEAVKELKAENDELKKRVEALENL